MKPILTPRQRYHRNISRCVMVKGPLHTKCWLWTGATSQGGYGEFGWQWTKGKLWRGRGEVDYVRGWMAPRWMLAYKTKVPYVNEFDCRHKCHNPLCIRPSHLEWGTRQENVQDMIDAGRQPPRHGEHSGLSKLTEKQVIRIRDMFDTGRYTKQRLADLYDVSPGLIGKIIRREMWKHV